MLSTTVFSRGDIVLVPLPFTGLTGQKPRPGLVMSSTRHNRATGDIVIAQITGNIMGTPRMGDHMIAGWAKAGLLAPSILRAKLATIEVRLIRRRLGTMPDDDLGHIEASLRAMLGF